jgi:glutathionyl-hydroquinone reductase
VQAGADALGGRRTEMAKAAFTIERHDGADKDFAIIGPSSYSGGMTITIDYDDVNHTLVDEEAEILVGILNKHWPDSHR